MSRFYVPSKQKHATSDEISSEKLSLTPTSALLLFIKRVGFPFPSKSITLLATNLAHCLPSEFW
jgi:hypothetical protein